MRGLSRFRYLSLCTYEGFIRGDCVASSMKKILRVCHLSVPDQQGYITGMMGTKKYVISLQQTKGLCI